MSESTPISSTLSTNLIALSNHIQSADNSNKKDQLITKFSSEVINEINTIFEKDLTKPGLSTITKNYLADVKLIIEAKEWNKLPESNQITTDVILLNKLAEDMSFVSQFVGVDINSVLSLLLEFARKNSAIQSEMRLDSRLAMFASALEEFRIKEKANAAEYAAGITSAVAGFIGAVGSMAGGATGLSFSRKSIGHSADNVKASGQLSKESVRLEKFKEMRDSLNNKIKEAIQTKPNDNDETKLRVLQKKLDEKINTTEKEINTSGKKLETMNQISMSENQVAVNASALMGGVGKIFESLINIGSAAFRNEQKTQELEAEKVGLAKNIANESNQSANDQYQKERESMQSIVDSLRSILQALDTSMSKQMSMS